MKYLEYNDNLISTVDISKNVALVDVQCYNNRLTSLDVSNNLELDDLACYGNPSLKEIWLKRGQKISSLQYDSFCSVIRYRD